MSARPAVVYVMPDKMGGVLTIIANLLEHRRPDGFVHRAVLTHNRLHTDSRANLRLAADSQTAVDYTLPDENMYAVVRRLAKAIGPEPGVLVCNDFVELLLVSLLDPGKTIVQILHGDYEYYYALATAHEPLVHAFVAYSQVVYENLVKRLPHRRESIFWLPYGIPIPNLVRVPLPAAAPLRLLFVGRLDEMKGVFTLPAIDQLLRDAAVNVTWTIVGSGPASLDLHQAWQDAANVSWIDAAAPAMVRALCEQHDVFVLPTRAEGLSVATVEAMSAGVVPVVTDLPAMAELAAGGSAALRIPVDDVRGFADAIIQLATDRERLNGMSVAARRLAVERFDIRSRVVAYQDLFARWRDVYRPRPPAPPCGFGSRLDQPWMPNAVVRFVRSALRRARTRAA